MYDERRRSDPRQKGSNVNVAQGLIIANVCLVGALTLIQLVVSQLVVSQFEFWMALISRSAPASYMIGARWRVPMAETAIQFLERWRQARVYAELRALEQLDETVAECIGAAAEDGISADDLERAAGGSLKEYLRTAIINTSE